MSHMSNKDIDEKLAKRAKRVGKIMTKTIQKGMTTFDNLANALNQPVKKGYVFYEKGKPYLVRCPKCGLENWAPRVASGQCSWCGYKAPREE